ncbi:MAG: 3-deoxy-D-manno-octulosonic acid transferase, partial [Planctomycetaceae bacterium]|nr:3-deoxy-D-manno-octulosonic acid transferase [Planctomycetaceae bacterium]
MRWLLNPVYLLLLTVLSPVILWRVVRHGRYRRGLSQKLLGRLPALSADHTDTRPVVWFHAVSVGEVVQLQKIADDFDRLTRQQFRLLVTTSTDTGFDLAIKRFPNCTVSWFPLDFTWSVRAALDRVRPTMLVLMELELWPNLIAECANRQIRTAVINARMSDRSVRGYQRIRTLLSPLLQNLDLIAAQSQQYADRLVSLGCSAPRTTVTGSIKFDGVETDRSNPRTLELREWFRLQDDEVVLMAGSTQDPEEEIALEAWDSLRHRWPNLRLLLVPRHRERFDAVATMVTSRGYSLIRRSSAQPDDADSQAVLLLDTIGELSACWGLADLAFVGGSFGRRGGQNMIEPAAYGAVIMFGPNTSNFRDVVRRFQEHNACLTLPAPADLRETVHQLLKEPELRTVLGT